VSEAAVEMKLFLGKPDDNGWKAVHRPAGVVLKSEANPAQQVLAFTWRDGGGDPIFMTWQGDGVANRSPSGSPR